MLARRFAIICLTVLIFGFTFMIVVAETSRPAGSYGIGMFTPCVFEQGLVCAPPRR